MRSVKLTRLMCASFFTTDYLRRCESCCVGSSSDQHHMQNAKKPINRSTERQNRQVKRDPVKRLP